MGQALPSYKSKQHGNSKRFKISHFRKKELHHCHHVHHYSHYQVCPVGSDDHCCFPDDPCVNLHRPVADWTDKPTTNIYWPSGKINGAVWGKRYLSTDGQHAL